MSTLQHTAQLRERATRRLVVLALIATIAVGAIAAGIVAIASGGSSPKVDASPAAQAQPMYASGALQRDLAPLKAARVASARSRGTAESIPTRQTPGQRP